MISPFPPLPLDPWDRIREIRRRKALLYPERERFRRVEIPQSARKVNPLTFTMRETPYDRVVRRFNDLFVD